jgi:prepilin-type N-terminal cleavage/methylation domain-containing protein
MSRRIKRKKAANGGFTLIECIIAMLVTVIGLLGALTLISYAIRNYTVSSDLAIANSLAKAKIEELRNFSQSPGGNLTANAAGYYDEPSSKFVRRWQITADSQGTQTLSVKINPVNSGFLLPEVNLTTKKN